MKKSRIILLVARRLLIAQSLCTIFYVLLRDDMFHLTRASRIGIVGAGPAGLCSGAKLKQAGFENVKIFEKSSELGGTWRYVPKPSPAEASSMYQNLRTNLPVQCMAFPDFPFQELETSFPGHEEVLTYLQNYSNHHKVTDMIEYNNGVETILNKTKEKPLWEASNTVNIHMF